MSDDLRHAVEALHDRYEATGTMTGHAAAWDMKDLLALLDQPPASPETILRPGEFVGWAGPARTDSPDPALREAPSETALPWIILRGGLRLPGFDHYRERATSKPSDPDDVRWDCSCGYSGSPETVERHWTAMLPALATPTPPDTALRPALRQAAADAHVGWVTKARRLAHPPDTEAER